MIENSSKMQNLVGEIYLFIINFAKDMTSDSLSVPQCEIKLAPKRSRLESSASGEDDDVEEDSDSDEESSAKARYFGYVKQGLYYVTEMERFAPPRKRPRTVLKNYRLLSLRSTTPEELYQRKVRWAG